MVDLQTTRQKNVSTVTLNLVVEFEETHRQTDNDADQSVLLVRLE